MALNLTNDADLSDEEISVGPITFERIKKELLRPLALPRRLTVDVTSLKMSTRQDDLNESVKIIETHSAPDIVSCHDTSSILTKPISTLSLSPDGYTSRSELNASDYSFLMHEKNAAEAESPTNKEREDIYLKSTQLVVTPCASSFFTPTKSTFATSTALKPDVPIFKTPGNPVSSKKQLGPQPRNRFEHIMSPVRAYIHDSPQAPLLKVMCPKKAVSGTSLIPKPVKHLSQTNIAQTETIQLPSVAYRSAKKTKVIDVKAVNKIPPSAKKLTSSIPKTVVLKHMHRETNHSEKPLPKYQQDTLDESQLLQAELSYCTQKSAKKL